MRVLVIAFVALTGCASVASAAGDRFAFEARCPRAQVEVEEVGGSAYVARGCGRRATYVCEPTTGAASIDNAAVCRRER